MTTTQYQNFVTVAECRSITGAARQLMVAQPALTSQIKRIEELVGAQLFIRHQRSVELTEAGRIFYQSAKSILQIEENSTISIQNLVTVGGTLHLGITPFLPDPGFSSVMERYYAQFPDVAVSLYEQNTTPLLSSLESGLIELASVVSFHPLPSTFEIIHESPSYLYACRSYDNDLMSTADGDEISFAQLDQLPLCVPHSMYHTLSEFCRQAGIAPIWKAVSDSRHGTLQLAQAGSLIGVMALRPQLYEELSMIRNRITDPSLQGSRYIVKLRDRELSLAARNFLAIAEFDML